MSESSLGGDSGETLGYLQSCHQPQALRDSVHHLKEEKKNKSELLHEAKLPLEVLTTLLACPAESWLPELPGA